MNGELRRLLAEAGYEVSSAEDGWRGVILLRNYGAVPPVRGLPDNTFLRDFKLLLLDRRGRPTHFAHCGSPTDASLERRTRLLEKLSSEPALAGIIPRTRGACSALLRVQLSAFVPGPPYARLVRAGDPASWAHWTSQILEVADSVGRRAGQLMPELLHGDGRLRIVDAISPKLDVLRAAGVPAPYLTALLAALDTVPLVTRHLQHGDLWPANVIRHDGTWWLIDFAEFGDAQVPLYDMFLYVHQTWRMLGLQAADEAWTVASQRIVAASAERSGLGPREVGGAMIYYLAHLSEQRLHHGSGLPDRAPFLAGVLRVAEALHSGCPIENLPLPWESPGPRAGAAAALNGA